MKKNNSLFHVSVIILISVILAGCSQKTEVMSNPEGDNYASQRKNNKFLAYTHSISIEIAENLIQKKYNDTINACTEATDFKCIIIHTELSAGDYTKGTIQLRVEPKGVNKIIQISTNGGEVTNKSTYVEDLAKPVKDNQKRRIMLETHRDQLIDLQRRPDNDIDSLVKISTELAKIQAELEQAEGENAHLIEKTELDMVNIFFRVEQYESFWKPIIKSIKNFSGSLSKGISETIEAIGYFIPWFITIIIALIFFRFVWRKTSQRK
ncbi:MAG TPA: DUF4349 domain-containing protein [Candidatus Competibacteraceae bacterium]|nr:DUF4349 domain-containing protein [Candidatus Competibacteraceae bacterium]MCP5134080.1 DUF4349 domain-containing protein [Gammaproteobacteria bacterium]HPF59012.1 DUF4349 domain-containing protein [Candidatus Competibacteraceae bacterium]HRY19628.1 DUF4349 domain-containing protein [Candidatus Competibacteraceae bacterium]